MDSIRRRQPHATRSDVHDHVMGRIAWIEHLEGADLHGAALGGQAAGRQAERNQQQYASGHM